MSFWDRRCCWVAVYIHIMIFYLMFALRYRQADFFSFVQVFTRWCCWHWWKLSPVLLLPAIHNFRWCYYQRWSSCYRWKINRRNNDTGDKHKVTNISANYLKKFKWSHEYSRAGGQICEKNGSWKSRVRIPLKAWSREK